MTNESEWKAEKCTLLHIFRQSIWHSKTKHRIHWFGRIHVVVVQTIHNRHLIMVLYHTFLMCPHSSWFVLVLATMKNRGRLKRGLRKRRKCIFASSPVPLPGRWSSSGPTLNKYVLIIYVWKRDIAIELRTMGKWSYRRIECFRLWKLNSSFKSIRKDWKCSAYRKPQQKVTFFDNAFH